MGELGARHDHAYFEALRRGLRWKLLVAYVTPLLVLAIVFHTLYSRTAEEGIHNHLKSIADNQRNTVDLFLQERVSNLRSAFRGTELTGAELAGPMQRVLEDLQRESSTFVDLGLFGPDGTLRSYAGPYPGLLGRNYQAEAWYQALLTGQRGFHISDVFLGFRQKPHFIIAVVRRIDDQPWVLRASVDPEKFGDFVGRSHLVEEAETFIINRQGLRQSLSHDQVNPPDPSPPPVRSGDTLVEHTQVGGQDFLRAVAWLTENDWALVVRIPTARAYAELVTARWVLLAIMAAALVGIVMVVLRSTRRMVARLEAVDTAKQDLTAQLFDAAKLASVGEIAAGVAHEINNPLAIIYEEASMMLDIMNPEFGMQLDMADFSERLGTIKDATMRGRTITRKLLVFARKQDPDPEPTDLNLLIDRVIDVKQTDYAVTNITVHKRFAPQAPIVMVNRNQMDQVMLNLLNNARDAMEAGGELTVKTEVVDGWVRIAVKDTGCGMPAEVVARIFFPFFTTKAVGKGTGLGLSISYGIIKSFGGRIEVNSEVGVGTTFSIYLPIADSSVAPAGGAHGRSK
jgi:two-component system NtrC family sensor kinase